MNLLAMLDRIEARGVRMFPDGEQIRIRPAGKLDEAERAAIMRHRPIVLELLRRRHDPVNAIAIPSHPVKPPASETYCPEPPEYAPPYFENGVIVYGFWIVPTSATSNAYGQIYEAAKLRESNHSGAILENKHLVS